MKISKKHLHPVALAALALGFASPLLQGAPRTIYWDPASSGSFGSINGTLTWTSPLNLIWTFSATGGTSRIGNCTTTLEDSCNWGGPTGGLGGGTVPVTTVNAGTLTFNNITGTVPRVTLSGGTITLASVTSVTANSAGPHTITSTLSGGATSFTKLGTGTITLSGSNTFTGPTAVSAGILDLGGSLALASSPLNTTATIAGDATNGLKTALTSFTLGGLTGDKDLASVFTTTSGGYAGVTSLTLNPGTGVTHTYSAAIADGAVGMELVKAGDGTQVLSGANTYTGTTSVNAGTLALDYGTLDGSKLSDTGTLVLGSGTLDLAGGTHTEVVASTTLTGTAKVKRSSGSAKIALGAISGTGTVDFEQGNIATTTNTNNAAGILGEFATVGGTNYAANDGNGNIVAYSAYVDITARGPSTVPNSPSGNVRILGDGTSGNIELAAATTTINTLLHSNASFAPTINTAGKILALTGITVAGTAESLNIGVEAGDGTLRSSVDGGTLALTNANAAKVLTINASIADNNSASGLIKGGVGELLLTSANTYTGATLVTEGTLNLGGSLLTSGLTVTTGAVLNVGPTGVIGGNATLTHDSASTSTLAGANTYSGATVISSGVLNIQHGSALGGTTAGTSVTNGAALQIQGSITVGNEALTIAGTGVSSSGALRNISGSNIFGGLVTLDGSTRIVSDSGLLTLNNPGTISGSGFSLTVAGAGDTLIGSSIGNGSGLLSKEGAGKLTLTAANSFSGTVSVSGGVLNIQNSTATGSTLGGVSVGSGSALELQGGISVGNETLILSGFGVANDGALRNISGDNSWGGAVTTGTTSIRINSDAGLLTIDVPSGSAFASSGVAVPNPSIAFGGEGNIIIADPIATGSGAITKDGAGLLTFSSANSYTGNTTVSGGSLEIVGAGSLGSGNYAGNIALTAAAGGTLRINSTANQTLAGVISGDGSLVKGSSGTLTLSNSNSFSGGITLGGGTLVANGAGSLGSGAVAVNGGTLLLNVDPASGAISVNSGGTLNLGGQSLASPVTLAAGSTLAGAGTISASSDTVPSTVNPGGTLGSLTFTNAALVLSGEVNLEIGGIAVGEYDSVVNNNGSISATGTVNVSFVNGFTPVAGNSWDLFSEDTTFASTADLNLPTLPEGLAWNTSTFASTGTVSVVATGDPVAAYTAAAGLTGNDALPGADPDGDGIKNSIEYALGISPTSSNGPEYRGVATTTPAGALSLAYRRPKNGGVGGVTYGVEFKTADLNVGDTGWTAGVLNTDYTQTVTPHVDGLTETVTITLTGAVSGRKFARLLVTY